MISLVLQRTFNSLIGVPSHAKCAGAKQMTIDSARALVETVFVGSRDARGIGSRHERTTWFEIRASLYA